MKVNVRPAKPEDCKSIHDLIMELALFERAPEKVSNTPEQLLEDGFGEQPLYTCFVAEAEAQVIGISFCYTRYSTWIGKVLYLEDLLVTELYRNRGIGTKLFEHTIAYGKTNGFNRISWQVLEWNESAIGFYKKFNAGFDAEWLNAWVDLGGSNR